MKIVIYVTFNNVAIYIPPDVLLNVDVVVALRIEKP